MRRTGQHGSRSSHRNRNSGGDGAPEGDPGRATAGNRAYGRTHPDPRPRTDDPARTDDAHGRSGVARLATAACGYWQRRGMHTEPSQVAVAPGAPLLLLALLAAVADGSRAPGAAPGSVLLPRPCSAWYAPQARLLGRTPRGVPLPAECGGVPDPFALLETVRRARAEGDEPRLLVLSVADDVTGTSVPPELLHEVCEAAADEGLLIVSDESWRDTSHDPHDTVVVSPAEMLDGTGHSESVVVLMGLGAALLAPGLHAGVARFPRTGKGRALGEAVGDVLDALHTDLSSPVAEAAAEALEEPEPAREQRAAEARLHGALAAALHTAVAATGAQCRPPRSGRQLYADLEQLRPRLAAHGITDAAGLEAELVRRLGPYVSGGHRFGDDPHALRVRLTTDVLAVPAAAAGKDAAGVRAVGTRAVGTQAVTPDLGGGRDPLEEPGAAEALRSVQAVLADLTDGSPR